MKIAGVKIEGRNLEIIPIPRGNGQPIIFKAEAIESYDEFDKMVKRPMPPAVLKAGAKEKTYKWHDQAYIKEEEAYQKKRMSWMCIESLKATDKLEWEKVDYRNPDTWDLWEEELKESGFSIFEITRIRTGVFTANCLNDAIIDAARESFVRGMAESKGSTSGPSIEQPST